VVGASQVFEIFKMAGPLSCLGPLKHSLSLKCLEYSRCSEPLRCFGPQTCREALCWEPLKFLGLRGP
jgi:hypothetical protein